MPLLSKLQEEEYSGSKFAQPHNRKRISCYTASKRARSTFTLVLPLSQEHVLQQFQGSFLVTIVRKNGRTGIVFNVPDSDGGCGETISSVRSGGESDQPLHKPDSTHTANLQEIPSKAILNYSCSGEQDSDVLERIGALLQASDEVMEYEEPIMQQSRLKTRIDLA
jgi:hypothetical protein